MKKAFKIVAFILVGILLFVICGAMYINTKGIPYYDVKTPDISVTKDSQSIANGLKIAQMLCFECHLGEKNAVLEGKKMKDLDSSFGTTYAPNITRHPEKGSGAYTDGELAYLLRTGIKKNGQYSPPWMVKLPNMAEEDMHDIIAFLRSDHPALMSSEVVQPASEPSFLVKMLSYVAFKPFSYPETTIQKPDKSDKIATGEYLANSVYLCFGCHSADFKTNDDLNPEKSPGFYGGGNILLDWKGNQVLSPNITLDKKTGIGHYTEADFIKAVRWGTRPDGTLVNYPMPKYNLMEDEEVAAIWAYLQTIPKLENDVKSVAME